MSRFAKFIKGITSPFVDVDGGGSTDSEKRSRVRERRRERYNSPDMATKAERGKQTRKQDDGGDINRLVTVNENVRGNIEGNARSKPYDPVFLRDISANAVVQAYIDTLSQDVASANWSIQPRDEEADIPEDDLAEVERYIKELPPGTQTFGDVLESTTRVLLELGDGVIVKHYYEDKPDRVGELVPVDSASIFKMVDKHGIPEGYVQISKRGGQMVDEFAEDDVIWAEWSNRPDRFYGQGPLEKAQNEVELIEELAEKERLDLIQGGPPGVLSPEALDEYGGLPNDEDWETFVEQMRLDAGERHRVGYSKTPVNFESVNHNYQELQILDRSKYWVTVIGSVFKVNPSYAGFDFQNTNRATDESQQEAYAQRGFRVTLRQLEESLNRGLIWADISEDVVFEFEQEQTVGERADRAGLIKDQAKAGMDMAEAGRTVNYRDGRLVVEDGEIEEGSDDGGGLFGSVDAKEAFDLGTSISKTPDGVPDEAVSINDPSEAPEDATVVAGPDGGLYYVPAQFLPDPEDEAEQYVQERTTETPKSDVSEGDVVMKSVGDGYAKAEVTGVFERDLMDWEGGGTERKAQVRYPSGYTSAVDLTDGDDTIPVAQDDFADVPHTEESTAAVDPRDLFTGEPHEREIIESINFVDLEEDDAVTQTFTDDVVPAFEDEELARDTLSGITLQDTSGPNSVVPGMASASFDGISVSAEVGKSTLLHETAHLIHQRHGYSISPGRYSDRQDKYEDSDYDDGELLNDPDDVDELKLQKLNDDLPIDGLPLDSNPWVDDLVDLVNDGFEDAIDSTSDTVAPTQYGKVGAGEFLTESVKVLNGNGNPTEFIQDHPELSAHVADKFDIPPDVEDTISDQFDADRLPDDEAAEAEAGDDDDFETFSECVDVNDDKSSPEDYCAVIFGFDETGDDEDDAEQI